jgi:spore maturation protein CgeB
VNNSGQLDSNLGTTTITEKDVHPMRVAMFYHSIRSCWNHGNAHFLRGVVTELLARGHEVRVFEPRGGWSITQLSQEHGRAPIEQFAAAFPALAAVVQEYDLETLDLEHALDGADLVLVHEWNDHALVARVGEHHSRVRSYRLLFHDTHHRSVTAPDTMSAYDLAHYDGVLAFGRIIRDLYIARGWAQRAWTWHEAADTRVFRPLTGASASGCAPDRVDLGNDPGGHLVWIGNWGDEERTAELQEFLLEPVRTLGLVARVHGVRYPVHARRALASAGITYGGWLPNHEAPRVFARHRVTVHVPRRPYVEALPGIPTIRPFEALACGIPLVCSPWDDVDRLFEPGEDYLVADDCEHMKRCLRAVLQDAALAQLLRDQGLRTIAARHTCGHRVDELLAICRQLGVPELAGVPGLAPVAAEHVRNQARLQPAIRRPA